MGTNPKLMGLRFPLEFPSSFSLGRRLTGICLAVALSCVMLPSAHAQSMTQFLTSAYHTNPTLKAAQQQSLSQNETYNQAVGSALPTVTGTGTLGYSDVRSGAGGQNGTNIVSFGLTASQPLYRGGAIFAGIQDVELRIQAQWYQLQAVEQSVLFDTVQAYMNLVRDTEFLRLTKNDVDVISNQLYAAQSRYDAGEGTQTDVALAQSALAGARANVASAVGALETSRSVLYQLSGQTAGHLSEPGIPVNLPRSLDEAVGRALSNDPQIIAALFNEKSAHQQITIQKAGMLPSADLQGSYSASWDGLQSSSAAQQQAQIIAQVNVPLYQGGRVISQVTQAKHNLNQALALVQEQRQRAQQAASTSWFTYQSNSALIPARRSQLDASRVALEGVRAEYDVGEKTILDVLEAEQQVLKASVDLTEARVNKVIAAYGLLASVGDFTATMAGLPVNHFDIRAHYKSLKSKSFDINWGD